MNPLLLLLPLLGALVSAQTPISITTPCICEPMMCLQMWPQSCYCDNAQKTACYQKCGGIRPVLLPCPLLPTTTLRTTTIPSKTSTTSIRPTRTLTPKPIGTHAPCGGGRANPYLSCAEGYTCIKDPYRPGCGPECDGVGICVLERMCGGFVGFPCPEVGMVCVDDARDGCDPMAGGADCGGLCVWPH